MMIFSPAMGPDEVKDRTGSRIAELEQEIKDLKLQLQERDEFLSVVGHELRNPISPLYMQVSVMRERAAVATDAVEKAWLLDELQRLQARLDHFLGCLNRLLDVSRIGEGNFGLQPESCDLVDVVTASISSFPEVRRLNIAITREGEGSVRGVWDRMRLEQIVWNLVSNAIRYGLGRPITVAVEADAERAYLRVQDRGIGIAKHELPSIFERFRRVGNTRKAAGFGVGLWVVAQLCQAMAGTIEVTSEVGKGSVFTVALPRGTRHD